MCSGGTGQFYIYSVSDPKNLRLELKHAIRGILYADMIPDGDIGGRVVVNWHHGGIAWFDLNGQKPALLKDLSGKMLAYQMSGFCAVNDRFFIPATKGGYYLLDPQDYAGEYPEYRVKGVRLAGVPNADGNLVAITNRRSGEITALDLSDPEKGRLIPERCYKLAQGHPDRIRFWNGKMLIPAAHLGLLMEK